MLGVPLGLLAAFHRGWTDQAIMRGVDLLISLPPVLLGLLVLAVTPPSLLKTIGVVGLVYVPILVRLTRAVALGLLEEEFVQAARARGEGALPILWHEVLPNAWPPIIVECGLRVTFAILLGSALSFLGLGPQPPASEWGLMIAGGRDFLTQAPWICLAPGLCLCLLLVSVNLVGEGLRERLDPHHAGRHDADRPIDRGAVGPLPTQARDCCMRCRTCRSPSRPARCWASSASPAPASPPSCLRCSACSRPAPPRPGASPMTGTTWRGKRPCCAAGASAWCSRTPPPPSTRP